MQYDTAMWGTVADWVSGIGTLVAVIVSLYLASRDNFKKVSVNGYFNLLLFDDYSNGEPMLKIDIVNKGKTPVNITSVGFTKYKINKYNNRFNLLYKYFPKYFSLLMVVRFEEKASDKLPIMIKSQEIKTFLPQTTITHLKEDKGIPKRFRIYAKDSTGKYYFSKTIKI